MMSLSHWGMFEAKNVPCRLWPLHWVNVVDTEFEHSKSGMEMLIQFLQDRDDRVLYGVPGFEHMGLSYA